MKKILMKKALLTTIMVSTAIASLIDLVKNKNIKTFAGSFSSSNTSSNKSENENLILNHDDKKIPNPENKIKKEKNSNLNITPEVIWANTESMKLANGKDTTDGIAVYYEEPDENSKFYNLSVVLCADLAPKKGSESVLKNFKNKDLKIKIIDAKTEKNLVEKTAKYYFGDNGKDSFDFMVKPSDLEVVEKKGNKKSNELYKIEIYDDEKLIGYFKQHLFLLEDPSKNESLKIQTRDKIDTSDLVTITKNKKGDYHISLHPRLHSFMKNNNNDMMQTKPSVFKGKNIIRVDFEDVDSGKVVFSKEAKVSDRYNDEENPDYNSKHLILNKSEVEKLGTSKPYNLKFYDDKELIGTKLIKNLEPIY